MTGEVFWDSGIFIAFLNRSDHFHREALALFSQLPRLCTTSILVIAETYSWLLHRSGGEAARSFRAFLQTLPDLVVLPADAVHQAKVWRKLDQFRGCKLTYVDASILVWLEERKIRTVWATDHHLGLEGTTVVPGPPG